MLKKHGFVMTSFGEVSGERPPRKRAERKRV